MSTPDDRGRLGPVADRVEGLDEAAQARVLSAIRSRGPAVVRRARVQRVVTRVGAPLAAVLLVLLWSSSKSRDEPPIASAPARTTEAPAANSASNSAPDSAPDPPVPAAPVPREGAPVVAPERLAVGEALRGRGCERWSPASGRFVREGKWQVLDLGRRGRVAALPGAEVALDARSSCETVLSLKSGSIVVRADELGSGALVVASRDGEVRVVGTVFAVESSRGRWVVEVAEGKVEVAPTHAAKEDVSAGQRYELTPKGSTSTSLSPKRLDEIVSHAAAEVRVTRAESPKAARREPAPRTPTPDAPLDLDLEPGRPAIVPPKAGSVELRAPPLSAFELVSRAERLRKEGEVDEARKIFRDVASGVGDLAEAALLSLASLELEEGEHRRAKVLAFELVRRFPSGRFAVEATWIAVRAASAEGSAAEARSLATRLVARWPATPYADSARAFLREHP